MKTTTTKNTANVKFEGKHRAAIQRVIQYAEKRGIRGAKELSKSIKASLPKSVIDRGAKKSRRGEKTSHHTSRTPISYNTVVDVLKKIGHASTTTEMVEYLLKHNKKARDYYKLVGEDKFKGVFYSAVSYLFKIGDLARKEIMHNFYRYSLVQSGGFTKENHLSNVPVRNKRKVANAPKGPKVKKIAKKKTTRPHKVAA